MESGVIFLSWDPSICPHLLLKSQISVGCCALVFFSIYPLLPLKSFFFFYRKIHCWWQVATKSSARRSSIWWGHFQSSIALKLHPPGHATYKSNPLNFRFIWTSFDGVLKPFSVLGLIFITTVGFVGFWSDWCQIQMIPPSLTYIDNLELYLAIQGYFGPFLAILPLNCAGWPYLESRSYLFPTPVFFGSAVIFSSFFSCSRFTLLFYSGLNFTTTQYLSGLVWIGFFYLYFRSYCIILT